MGNPDEHHALKQADLTATALAAYAEATERQIYHQNESETLARKRAIALHILHGQGGLSYAQIAGRTGLSATRVGYMIRSVCDEPAPEPSPTEKSAC